MTTEKRHGCGGVLVAGEVQVHLEDERAGISLTYRVPGLICNKCREQLIDRKTALQLQASQTPTVAWHPGGINSTWLDAIRFDPLTAHIPREAIA